METVKKKKNMGGRPKQLVRKETIITLRLDKSEHFIVRQKAGKAGLTISRYVRWMAIHGTVKARMTPEERQLVRQLVGMSNNINQTAKCCHKEGALSAMRHFEGYRNQITELLKQLKDDK